MTNRQIQIIAALIMIATLLIAVAQIGQSFRHETIAPVANPVPNSVVGNAHCAYDLPPEESGLTPYVYINVRESESFDLTFGVITKLHAECIQGFVRYWITDLDPSCLTETITLLSDGTWACNMDDSNGGPFYTFRMGGLWIWPNGQPDQWIEPEAVPLITPAPAPYPGQETG